MGRSRPEHHYIGDVDSDMDVDGVDTSEGHTLEHIQRFLREALGAKVQLPKQTMAHIKKLQQTLSDDISALMKTRARREKIKKRHGSLVKR